MRPFNAVCGAIAMIALGSPAARAQSPHWELANISPRYGHTMVFDSGRGEVVLFGGVENSLRNAETWVWNGSIWSQRFVNGPTARYQHAMVYDSLRGVSVLYGGTDSINGNQDTWEWNGSAWSQKNPAIRPYYRTRHAMSFDSRRGVTVLYGGDVDNRTSNETWEWDGTTWRLRTIPGPPALSGHAMTFDAARGVTVLFGGSCCGGALPESGETWEYDGNTWTRRSTTGPAARVAHSMLYDATRGVVVLTGGATNWNTANGACLGDTWEWNGTAWTQLAGNSLTGRGEHAMCMDATGKTILFGGLGAGVANGEQWELVSGVWTLRSVSGPTLRSGHAMAFDSTSGVTTLFGGGTFIGWVGDVLSNETWEWNGAMWSRRSVSGPSAREGAVMAFDSFRGETVLFGGSLSEITFQLSSETWVWNGMAWSLRPGSQPTARSGAAMAYDSLRRRVVMFGGVVAINGFIGDTQEWNGAAWTQVSNSGPSPRGYHAMAYDSIRHVTTLFGGSITSPIGARSNETWEWNGSTWTLRSSAGPSPRSGHAMAYDQGRRVTVLTGGATNYNDRSDEMWEWDGERWISQSIARPSARAYSAMAYDLTRHTMVEFGGEMYSLSGETWLMRFRCDAPAVASIPDSLTVCPSGIAGISIDVNGNAPLMYQWQHELTPGSNGWIDLTDSHVLSVGMVSGSTTRTLHISAFEELAHGAYRCIVNNPCGTVMSQAANLAICATDFNCDNIVDLFDYLDFIAALADDLPAADFNGDGVTDFFDYLDFVDAFSSGC